MKNLESHGNFRGLESPEIEVWVIEKHGKAIPVNLLRINRKKNEKLRKWQISQKTSSSKNK